MTKSNIQSRKYAELDAILDFAYSADARRQASRERNATIAKLFGEIRNKKPVAKDENVEVCAGA